VSYVDAWVDMNVKMLRENAALDDIVAMNPSSQGMEPPGNPGRFTPRNLV
jgi:hypothetical protein